MESPKLSKLFHDNEVVQRVSRGRSRERKASFDVSEDGLAEREDIRSSAVERLLSNDFRRHVVVRAREGPLQIISLLTDQRFCEAEVAQEGVEVFVEKHILRLDIFMAVAFCMQELKTVHELFEDVERNLLAESSELEHVVADAAVRGKVEY